MTTGVSFEGACFGARTHDGSGLTDGRADRPASAVRERAPVPVWVYRYFAAEVGRGGDAAHAVDELTWIWIWSGASACSGGARDRAGSCTRAVGGGGRAFGGARPVFAPAVVCAGAPQRRGRAVQDGGDAHLEGLPVISAGHSHWWGSSRRRADRTPAAATGRHHMGRAARRLVIYDAQGGGLGVTSKAFDMADLWLEGALSLMEQCACDAGCASCTRPGRPVVGRSERGGGGGGSAERSDARGLDARGRGKGTARYLH